MNGQCINIAISGMGISVASHLKLELRKNIPDEFGINWINIAEPNIDLLLINESFSNIDNIQKIIQEKKPQCLKVAKDISKSGNINNDTLYVPFEHSDDLSQWIQQKLLNQLPEQTDDDALAQNSPVHHVVDEKFLRALHNPENACLHLFDHHGTLAIVDTRSQMAWLEPTRLHAKTNISFNYCFASTSDFTKVSRKVSYHLQDWLWNLFWNSPDFKVLAAPESHYQIDYWPQPYSTTDRKNILQLSAAFIQGAQIAQVANELKLPIEMVQQFVAAAIAANNGRFVSAQDCRFLLGENKDEQQDKTGFLGKLFSKMRRRFGI